jgi:hypothetical protein
MPRLETKPYYHTVAVLTSMHAKERVIGPILRDELGLIVGLAIGVNTDQFGSFSREVERTGSQLDAAKARSPPALNTPVWRGWDWRVRAVSDPTHKSPSWRSGANSFS